MIDYIGSKTKLIDWLFSSIQEVTGDLEDKMFLDGCAGTGSVSFRAKELSARVFSNDLLHFSPVYISGYANLSPTKLTDTSVLISEINKLVGEKGFFYNNYSENAGRLYFTDDNAKKIDSIRSFIKTVEDVEVRDYLLACLLEAVSRVSNTAGTHGAFLKKFKQRALDPIILRVEEVRPGKHKVEVSNEDLVEYLKNTNQVFDVFYLDPPYTSRQYAPNYHLYETLIKNDNPKIHGKTGLRDWQEEADSKFCREKGAKAFFSNIYTTAKSKNIFVSYSSDGLLSKDQMLDLLKDSRPTSKVSLKEYPYKRYKADSNREYNQEPLIEYLFISTEY